MCRSAVEPMVRMQHKVSASLRQALEKMKLSDTTAEMKGKQCHAGYPPHILSCRARVRGISCHGIKAGIESNAGQ